MKLNSLAVNPKPTLKILQTLHGTFPCVRHSHVHSPLRHVTVQPWQPLWLAASSTLSPSLNPWPTGRNRSWHTSNLQSIMNSLPDYFFVCYYICFTDHRVVDMSMYQIYFIAGWLPDIADSLTQWLHNLTVFLILVALPKSLQFASSPMPSKCKHNSKTVPSSQLIAEDDAVSLQVKWQRADQLFDDKLMPLYGRFVQLFNVFWPCLVADEFTQYRHSSCAEKGSGRQLQQLYNIKSAQTARHPWQSTQNLDIAMQDKLVNPMAPGYPDDKQKSQISPWVAASIHHLKSKVLKCGHHSHIPNLVNHSVSSSLLKLPLVVHNLQGCIILFHSLAIYQYFQLLSHEVLYWQAFTPCLNAGLIASINETTCIVLNWLHPNDCCNLKAENHTLNMPQRNSHISTHSSQSLSGTPIQGQHPVHDDDPLSPPPQPVGLCRTQSFSQFPSTIPKSHTMFAGNTKDGVGPEEDNLVIDKVSPSKDDCFAEAVVHSESESCYFHTCESQWFICPAGDPSHGINPSEENSQFGTLQFQGDYPCGFTNTQQSKLSIYWYVVLKIQLRDIEDIVAQHHQSMPLDFLTMPSFWLYVTSRYPKPSVISAIPRLMLWTI